jgi:hypothetical protein
MAQQVIKYKLEIKWDWSLWTDESIRLISANGSITQNAPGTISSGRGATSYMDLVLDNRDNRYSPLNDSGALYSYLQDGKAYHAPCRLSIRTDGGTPTGTHAQFVGVIKMPVDTGKTGRVGSTVTLRCAGREEVLLQSRISTTQVQFIAAHDGGFDESDIIEQYLDSVGSIADGTDYVSQTEGGTTTLDRGMFVIPWAWLDDESPIEDIWQLAAACNGRFFCNPADGLFYYHNATHYITASRSNTSNETFTERDVISMSYSYEDSDTFDQVTVEYSGRDIAAVDVIWQPNDTISVPADSTITYTATLQQPCYDVTAYSYTATTGGGVDITSDVTVTASEYAQRIIMTITNANTTYSALMRQFSISGRPVTGQPTAEETRTSTDDGDNSAWWTNKGSRTRSIRSNPYMQTRAQACMLADMLLGRQEYAGLKYRIVTLGRYDRYLGDRVTIYYTGTIQGSPRTAIITGIQFRLSSAGYIHTIEAVDTEHLYPLIDDATYGYFIIGTSYLGNGGTNRAKLFY